MPCSRIIANQSFVHLQIETFVGYQARANFGYGSMDYGGIFLVNTFWNKKTLSRVFVIVLPMQVFLQTGNYQRNINGLCNSFCKKRQIMMNCIILSLFIFYYFYYLIMMIFIRYQLILRTKMNFISDQFMLKKKNEFYFRPMLTKKKDKLLLLILFVTN